VAGLGVMCRSAIGAGIEGVIGHMAADMVAGRQALKCERSSK
jgi:hypothetical protein